MHLSVLYNVGKFQSPTSNTFRDMNYFLLSDFWSSPDYGLQTTDYRQAENDAYEPTVQSAQVGSKMESTPVTLESELAIFVASPPAFVWNP